MNMSFYLSEADQQCLRSIVKSDTYYPKPTFEQKSAIEKILSKAAKSSINEDPQSHVGFNDRVSLVSQLDSRDYFNLRIVMPEDADADQDLISVLLPVSLALIGRRCGENVSWEGPQGKREMRIVAVTKYEKMAA
jgi:transcription elongation GreA/GreB family factor